MRTIRKIEQKISGLKQRKKVAAYARVSMESERMHHSLSAQVSYYSKLIQKNPNWEYAGVYADYGISGTGIKKRQEFRRMLEDAEAGKIDIILTKSIQRFARNTVDLLQTVRHLKELGIEVWFEKENIHTMSGDGELMLTILASLLMCDKEAIEVQKILPFLSDTWPLCRIGRAVIRASQSCRQSCNKSQCPACGCRSHHSCTHAPQFSRSFPAREWGSVLQRQGACGQCP